MKRLMIIAVLSLTASLGGQSYGVLAQTNSGLVVIDDASGSNGTNGGCLVSGSRRDRRSSCSEPREPAPVATDVSPTLAPAPAPVPDAASAPETTDTTVGTATDSAVATATDQDADNALDELEPGLGLDPRNPDTDGDNVADGDERNIYGTDPLNADTDGDGVSDGAELFGTYTDPLVSE